MPKFVMIALMAIMSTISMHAVVACPDPAVVVQPDGSRLTVVLHGDEWFNYSTTADGYTVVKDVDGFYKYAVLAGDMLRAGETVAHDAAQRTASEAASLSAMQRHLTPSREAVAAMRAPARRLHGMTGHYDYKNFRGLVILVEYNDCPFQYEDAHGLFNGMVNDKDYRGFMSNAQFPELIPYTGSVRDYFYASSAGEFDPVFDVVGPVKINYSQYDANKTSAAQALVTAALKAADDQVNYADYDRDGNKSVDMVFFVFSGAGSNFSGNDQRLIWPHASSITSLYLDGVSFGRYACSTELYSRPESKIIDGIGTMCHEFSHVLGIADLYDTDGASSGGSSVTPRNWSVMAHGNYNNMSRTPCLYSTYERYAAGFITPETITRKGNYTLRPLAEVNNGYRLDSPVPGEYFLLETRTKAGWDAYLPGEGMLVWRVDSTDVTTWDNNKVNCNPAHNLYELLRAGGDLSADAASDPFPGSKGITAIDNFTTPSLRSWTGRNGNYSLSNITRNSNGSVSFHLGVTNYEDKVEDFEEMSLTTADATKIQGRYTTWSLTKGALVAETASENGGNGKQACSMLRSSIAESGKLPWEAQGLRYDFYNPTTSTTVVRTYWRQPNSTSWVSLKNDEGLETVSVPARSKVTVTFNNTFPEGCALRIVEYSGSRTDVCYLDDIAFTVVKEEETIPGDLNGDGSVDVVDVNVLVNSLLNGIDLPDGDLNGDGAVDIVDANWILNKILNP